MRAKPFFSLWLSETKQYFQEIKISDHLRFLQLSAILFVPHQSENLINLGRANSFQPAFEVALIVQTASIHPEFDHSLE